MSLPRVGVLFGGRSSEREISLKSGKQVFHHLPADRYDKTAVFMDTTARFWEITAEVATEAESTQQLANAMAEGKGKLIAADQLKERFDIIFPVFHGSYGEDGTIQGMFEILDVPYIGSGVRASANAMHKSTAKILYREFGLPAPRDLVVYRHEGIDVEAITAKIGLPAVVKPMEEGSSVGITIAKTPEELKNGLDVAFKLSSQVLIEEFVKGLEITVGVFGTKNPIGLPVIEIVPKHDFFDFEAKYDPQLTDEICPARISDDLAEKAKDFGVRAHLALGCRTFSRTDMIIRDNELFLLETNTLPGMTSASLLPKSAKAHGWDFGEFLDQVVKDGLAQ